MCMRKKHSGCTETIVAVCFDERYCFVAVFRFEEVVFRYLMEKVG